MSPSQTPSAKLSLDDNGLADVLVVDTSAQKPSGKNAGVKTTIHDLSDGHSTPTTPPPNSHGDLSPTPLYSRVPHPRHRPGWPGTWSPARFARDQWRRNKAPLMVFTSQLFGALMNLGARMLELDHGSSSSSAKPMHPIQILFGRMLLTTLVTSTYLYRIGALLGPRELRPLLAARGVAGFLGVYGMWYSAMYLPLAEATVITFLAPNLAGYMCHVLLGDAFTRREVGAGILALAGVVLITRPASFFGGAGGGDADGGIGAAVVEAVANATTAADTQGPHPTTAQRLAAVGMALVGVVGGAAALTAMRCIGTRAHPLTSVNYFSAGSALVTTATLLSGSLSASPDGNHLTLAGALPASARHAALLLLVTASGLAMLVLLTAGLAAEKSNRATAMLYTHMLFAAAFDRWVFGTAMGWASLLGCGLIVGSAAWVALTKGEGRERVDVESRGEGEGEGVSMLRGEEEEDEGEEEGVYYGDEEGRRV
ncbi:hypothetical protein F4810DRAFT_192060 [Camillea tinctor]|nr:hypothetical protein F4810DRAFT_192060 [Camillea tinctor]